MRRLEWILGAFKTRRLYKKVIGVEDDMTVT